MKDNRRTFDNVAWFGPVTEDQAECIVDKMLDEQGLREALKQFLTHEIPPSGFSYVVQDIAEQVEAEIYPKTKYEKELAHDVDEHEQGVPG
jgi:hypothetical protein